MSIKFKLMLALDLLVLAAVTMFGGIMYNSEKALLQRQVLAARSNALQSLANVTTESLLSQDDTALISYTSDLKRIISELEVAYVIDGRKRIMAHTDPGLAPRQLPLSNSGPDIRPRTDRLLVRSELRKADPKGVSFSKKTIEVNGRSYTVAVGYSDRRVKAGIQATLEAALARIVKAGALVILSATLLALWLASLLTRPIKKLAKAFAVTGEGRLDYKLPDTARRDEIGTLNREFNGMVDKLKELDQLKKDFVSSVTHELKSPIGAIESYLDLMSYDISRSLKDPAAWPAKLPKFLENIFFIKQNSTRLLRFIGDLLDAARIEKGKFEISRKPSRLAPVLQEAVKLFQERAKESGIELSVAGTPEKLPEINIDAERVSQVLVNLVSNALKFTPRGGKVTVTACLTAAPPAPEAPTEKTPARKTAGSVIRVSVEDTGSGIPPEALGKLFGKFYQVSGVRNSVAGPKGTGLGLYIVRSIVEAHGGRAFAESSGKGSRFSFELPA